MDNAMIVINASDDSAIVLSNAVQARRYQSETILLPDGVMTCFLEGCEAVGLKAIFDGENNTLTLEGVPSIPGEFTFTLNFYIDTQDEVIPIISKEIKLYVQPNARALWRDLETPKDIDYYKEDTFCEYVMVDGMHSKDMVAASRRGRSHAKDGRPRDDHFRLAYCCESGWYIMAVADGAGSAKFSRQGSKIACDTVVEYCINALDTDIDSAVETYQKATVDSGDDSPRKAIGDKVYRILGNAAYKAHKNINAEAASRNDAVAKDFATTLLLAICKRYDFGWFIATFWVGDGAICLYDAPAHTATLLGVPDEGEFSGQTRFITMPEIFADPASIYRRLRVEIRKDFTALMLMTDGVSDPMFGTDANLNNVDKWDDLWRNIHNGYPEDEIPGVDLTHNNVDAKDTLLQWLSFWAIGEHDDRTIAILY